MAAGDFGIAFLVAGDGGIGHLCQRRLMGCHHLLEAGRQLRLHQAPTS
jgi:hypothetical protein